MKDSVLTSFVGALVVGSIGMLPNYAVAQSGDATMMSAHSTPVIVELFTSEGCNDCPPADMLLRHLREDSGVAGTDVIALEEHVDYFNNPIHWVDPFSKSQFTDRQSGYASRLNLDSDYTPQMVVGGTTQFVGSDSDSAYEAIMASSRLPEAAVSIDTTSVSDTSATLRIAVSALPSVLSNSPADIYVALTEVGLTSRVTGGENRGHTLYHSAVVRVLQDAGQCPKNGQDLTITLPISHDWQLSNLRAVAFVQVHNYGRIVGAAETRIHV